MEIEFINVNKSFYSITDETKVLKDINIEIPKGKIIAIVGPSGCGKSTILNLISGLIKPTSGKVIVNGTVGYMFQKDNLLEWRNVYKNITLGPEIQRIKIDEEKIDTILKKYGLIDFKYKHPSELSGGMRQRVALIRTLILNPDILLLDEPFSALDFQTRLNVCDDVWSILKSEKKTAILVTHDISEAISMADEILVLSKRPARIIAHHVLDLDKTKTPLKRREDKNFAKWFDILWKELNYEE